MYTGGLLGKPGSVGKQWEMFLLSGYQAIRALKAKEELTRKRVKS